MSSAFPTSSGSSLEGLGLLGCRSELDKSQTPSVNTPHSNSPSNVVPDASPTAEPVPAVGSKTHYSDSPQKKSKNGSGAAPKPVNGQSNGCPRLHRVDQVRQSQGLTERTVAKRMGLDIRSYRRIECPETDLSLTELSAAQRALEVPIVDLLEDNQALSRPVEERAKLVKVMKTAVAISEAQSNGRVSRLAEMLCEQLVDLMPELKEVGGWPQFGARRGKSAIGKALSQPIDTTELGSEG